MIWKISEAEFNKLSPEDKKSGFFKAIPNKGKKEQIGPKVTKPFWASYGNLPKLGIRARRKYEIFCGGFLFFYDNDFMDYLKEVNGKVKGGGNKFMQYFKKKSFNHDISFEWGPDNEKPGRRRVTVYLDPPAGNPDPPTPPPPPPPESST